eukprot:9257428-Karenia_brevis.AAC.1
MVNVAINPALSLYILGHLGAMLGHLGTTLTQFGAGCSDGCAKMLQIAKNFKSQWIGLPRGMSVRD